MTKSGGRAGAKGKGRGKAVKEEVDAEDDDDDETMIKGEDVDAEQEDIGSFLDVEDPEDPFWWVKMCVVF